MTSPGSNAVSSPRRSRMCDEFTNRLIWRRNRPVSSQMLRYKEGCRRSSSSRAARTLEAMIESCETPSQQTRSSRGTWIVMFADGVIADLSHFWPILPTLWRVGMPHESTPHRAADEETNHKSDDRTD